MQSIEKHIDTIMIKFKKANGYSELPQDTLRDTLKDYLMESHSADMEALSVQMEIEQLQGVKIDEAYYKKEYTKIKHRLNDRIAELIYMGEDKVLLLN